MRLVDLFWLIAPEFHQDGIVDQLAGHRAAAVASARSGRRASSGSCAGARFCRFTIRSSPRRSARSSSAERRRARRACELVTATRHEHDRCRCPDALRRVGSSRDDERHRHRARSSVRRCAARRSPPRSARRDAAFMSAAVRYSRPREPGRVAAVRSRPSRSRVPPEPRLQVNPRQDLATYPAREEALLDGYAGSTRTPASSGFRSTSAMKLTVERGLPHATGATDEQVPRQMKTPSVLRRPCAMVHRCDAAARADRPVAPAARRTAAERGGAARRRLPAPLREIGFDQRLDEPLPLDTVFPDETGRAVRSASYFGAKPVVLVFVVLRLPDAVHAGPQRAGQRRSTCSRSTPASDFDVVTVSFDPRETPATRRGEEAALPRALQAAGAGRRLAFPDRRPGVDRAR